MRWTYVLASVVGVALMGAGSVWMKIAYEGMGPLWCATLRFGMASVLFALVFGRTVWKALRVASPRFWLGAALCAAGSYASAAISVNYTTATTAGFFFALPMLFSPLISWMISRERIRMRTVVLQAAVIVGLYLLCCNTGAPTFGLGELMGLSCSAFYAGALVLGARAVDEIGAVPLTVVQVGATFAVVAVLALVIETPPTWTEVPLPAWAAIVALAVFASCAAFYLENLALERVDPVVVSIIVCAEPLFTAVIAVLVLVESLTPIGLAGGAVIVACTVIAALPSK